VGLPAEICGEVSREPGQARAGLNASQFLQQIGHDVDLTDGQDSAGLGQPWFGAARVSRRCSRRPAANPSGSACIVDITPTNMSTGAGTPEVPLAPRPKAGPGRPYQPLTRVPGPMP
jgi:hypothetical protein